MRNTEITALIERWTADGVVTTEQARRMSADVPPSVRRGSLLPEGLGYLGGALVAVALSLATGWYWADLGRAGRLAVVGGAAVAFAVAGAAVPAGTAGVARRLRAVLWALACAALFGFLVLLADDSFGWSGRTALSFAAALVLPCAGALWALHRNPLQHVVTYVSFVVLAASLVALLPSAGVLPGVAAGAAGWAWGLLAWGGVVRPRQLGRALGALGAVAGAVAVAGEGWGVAPAVATPALLIAAAVLMRDVVVLAIAAVGTVLVVPGIVTRYFPGAIGAALALLAAGLLLVVVAVLTARRPRPPRAAAAPAGVRDWTVGPARIAVAGAAVLLAATTVIVVIAGR
ncbi:hypothetical protein GCM10020358_09030 [Amorphoplanes nipponensis]|uniref:DUF2157 domain-containing protein n=1 Tax=Actinoplanes nipponensis TaxID=135950 RepID=A0A919MR04_9ACTN|nr:DUF2157 domain-containing protein [Actinoplanes nipponensis]GIE54171.1 hypothetical protein Ani05nite_77050 [Actinoplanes nipponensis]